MRLQRGPADLDGAYDTGRGVGRLHALLNGALDTIESDWNQHLPVFAARYRVLAYDHRGHGRTDNPSGGFTGYNRLADDLARLLDITGIGTAHLCGFSDGAITLIAENLSAYDFFIGCQNRALAAGVVYAPEEAYEDPHFRARGFQVEVEHPELGRTVRYPGAPYVLPASPWRISRRAPRLGEHNEEILGRG